MRGMERHRESELAPGRTGGNAKYMTAQLAAAELAWDVDGAAAARRRGEH